METIKSGTYKFSYDADTCDPATKRLDGMTCFVHDRDPYWLKVPAGEAKLWAEFYGAHDLEFCPVERMAPVPLTCLSQHETDEVTMQRNERRHERRRQLNEKLFNYNDVPYALSVDLGKNAMRGVAGIIIPGPGAAYSWTCDGVSLSWRTMVGTYVPLGGQAAEILRRWGDNVYTNSGDFDVELFNAMLGEHLPGWVVDQEVIDASCEACVFIKCVRDVYPGEDNFAGTQKDFVKQFGPAPETDSINPDYDPRRWEWLQTPLGSNYESPQAELVGTRAVLLWGNSD